MSNVDFNYSTMGAGKTALACIKAYNYEQQGLRPMCLSPITDLNKDNPCWDSRIPTLTRDTIGVAKDTDIELLWWREIEQGKEVDVIIIDEVQFITVEQVEQLFRLSIYEEIPIICYGLLIDYKTNLWEASKRLIELGANLKCIPQVGSDGSDTVISARISSDGTIIKDDESTVKVEKSYYRAVTLREYWDAKE